MSEGLVLLLRQTLEATQAKNAEKELRVAEGNPGFSQILLGVVSNSSLDLATRQAGALFFKNYVKRRWPDESPELSISQDDKTAIKDSLVKIMTALPISVQVQIGETVTLIANEDFPSQWQSLIDELISNISMSDMTITNGVLHTAHSIFKRWRAQFRSDELFTEIAFVLQRFCKPFLAIVQQTDVLIQQHSMDNVVLDTLFETMLLLTKIFYDLNSQDIPEFFEDYMTDFMGIFHKYLGYVNQNYETSKDDDVAGPVDKVKASICEIVELYTQRYEEVFPMLPDFVSSIWQLLTQVDLSARNDLLVSRALSFLTCVVKIPRHNHLFESDATQHQLVERIVLPNLALRESDQELFEDDPIEFIRRDLEGSDNDTRRRAATEFVKALVSQFDERTTKVILQYVEHYLQQYHENRSRNWQAKDTANYLITSIAIKGAITKSGVTATNPIIDLVQFFNDNVIPDLQGIQGSPHAILLVDAIKFVYVFRNQITKEQMNMALPLLAGHLTSSNYVVFTYSAVAIDALLTTKVNGLALFAKTEVATFAGTLLQNLLELIIKGISPEKIAENDFLIRCVMRILLASQDLAAPHVPMTIEYLNKILAEVSKNPANPKFNHYLFESYAAIIRYLGPMSLQALEQIESLTVSPLLSLLQNDVTEFIPYVFQLLAQMLELHQEAGLPVSYSQLLQPILTPALWDSRGNVPALVRLMQAFIRQGSAVIIDNDLLEPVLGIFQKLIASKVLDIYGLDLIESIYTFVPPLHLKQYNQQIFMLLLTRLNNSRTETLTLRFVVFICYLAALPAFGPNLLIDILENIQAGLFSQIFRGVILPNTQKIINPRETKIVIIGLTKFIRDMPICEIHESQALWLATLNCLLRFLELPALETSISDEFFMAEMEETGFQASFVKLSVASKPYSDPWITIRDPKEFFIAQMNESLTPRNVENVTSSSLPDDTKSLLSSYGIQF